MRKSACLFTIDVEEWFHSENLPIFQKDWDSQVSLIEQNLDKLLSLLEEFQVKGTFFVLGWVAERQPQLVLRIQRSGHEIACHGYNHQLIYKVSEAEFREDIRKSKMILEDITGEQVYGYRASNFSITDWAIKILQEEGFVYDSSFFMVSYHDRYGKLTKYGIKQNDDIVELEPGFWEVTIPALNFAQTSIPWGGGGYFRLFPYQIFKFGIQKILRQRSSYLFYLHPREIDPDQPYLDNLPGIKKFRHYAGLKRCESRLRNLLKDFSFFPIKDLLKEKNVSI